ncbi:restriction endonuclease subunit S [Nocardiopsis sp. FR4]|uniref:restriction endonuclease subunit S n=1 Tax=Nocardiopsis sp. FR4 TaxID=2605985 RepID=UPI00135B529E|nr:restriction endonuclease subunit S [Nocardiopsis sp. FR4]
MTEDLPAGWTAARLAELGQWYGGATPSKAKPEFWENGTIPWVSPKDMGQEVLIKVQDTITQKALESSPVRLVPENSVAFVVRSGVLERRFPVALTVGEVTLNQDMKAIHPNEAVDARWLAWGLRWMEQFVLRSCRKSGTTVASVQTTRLMDISFPVPPLAEQRRVIGALETELSRLDMADRQLAQAQVRLVHLRARFVENTCLGRGRGGAETSAQLTPAAVDDGMIPNLPAGWEWKRLQEIADVVGGVTKDARKQSDPDCAEVPYLRVANVQKGVLDLTQVNTIRVPPEKASQLELLPGDVLLNEGGDRDKLGRGWIWEGQIPGCIHQNHVFRARVRDGVIHPKLLSWHANEFGQRWCQANGKQSVNLASISLSKIRLLPVPVPPEEEQAELVKKLENAMAVFDRTAEQLASARAKATALRKALLNTAFTGKLVPQDPSDEAAAALLERAWSERASVPKPKRARRSTIKTSTRLASAADVRAPEDPQPVHAGEQTALEF